MSSECCSICLYSIRRTRRTCILECGHMYHPYCFSKWEESGGDTCPLCRNRIRRKGYKVHIVIENTATGQTSNVDLSEDEIRHLFDRLEINNLQLEATITEIEIDIENPDNVRELVEDLGVRLTRFDPAILDTE